MTHIIRHRLPLLLGLSIILLAGCAKPGYNNPGSEYVPDMTHGIAYEANYYDYYSLNTFSDEHNYYEYAKPRKPVPGTIARGQVGNLGEGGIRIQANGSVPYYYGDSEDERTRAIAEITENPYPISASGLVRGKELYNTFCAICHGEKGDGNGWLVAEENFNAVYPAQPANFLSDEFKSATPGRYYHSIIYGKNVMGGYSDKLSYEERWQVIHYIRSLQAKDGGQSYSEMENTFNTVGIPASHLAIAEPTVEAIETIEAAHDADHDADHHIESDHKDDHDGGH